MSLRVLSRPDIPHLSTLYLFLLFFLLDLQEVDVSLRVLSRPDIPHLSKIYLFLLFVLSDLQEVNVSLRVLSRPDIPHLSKIFQTLGVDYDDRVLPSIGNEILKSVIVCRDGVLRYFRFVWYFEQRGVVL